MGIKTKPTSYKFVFFYMTLFLLVLLLYFSIEESLAFRPLQCLDFPLCCAHVFSHLSALPWQNSRQQGFSMACPHPRIKGKYKWLHRHPQPAANIQTMLGQDFCFAKDLQNTTVLFYFVLLHHHGYRNCEIPQRYVYLSSSKYLQGLHIKQLGLCTQFAQWFCLVPQTRSDNHPDVTKKLCCWAHA